MRFVRTSIILYLLCVGSVLPATAQFPLLLTPNGNPTGPATADSPIYWDPYPGNYTVTVDGATTGLEWPVNIGVEQVLANQGFNVANGWTINRFDLQGNLRLDFLYAWAEKVPEIHQDPTGPNPIVLGELELPGQGGAAIGLHYLPQGTDPVGDLHWIQVVATNVPLNNPPGILSGNTLFYLDNVGNPAGNPFCFGLNSNNFVDTPARPYSDDSDWRGYTFIATGDLDQKILNISNGGVYWGFHDPFVATPEPSSAVLVVLGCILLFIRSRFILKRKPLTCMLS